MHRTSVPATLLLFGILAASAPQDAEAQRHTYSKGQALYPAYEGWVEADDGSRAMLFGYMNENWEQLLDIPVGPDNRFSPGEADRGQPTHFLPRRNRFVFEVPVPPDFGEGDELVWTLRANGHEYEAYGTLRQDLFVDNVVVMSETGALGAGTSSPEMRANIPPVIDHQGDLEVTVSTGQRLRLETVVTDDGQPDRSTLRSSSSSSDDDEEEGEGSGGDGEQAPAEDDDDEPAEDEEEEEEPDPRRLLEEALDQSTATVTVSKRLGLHFTWFVYRGPGEAVDFAPAQIKPWEDTRPFANSPWARAFEVPEPPEDDRWVTEVTFTRPGTYILRGRADDGGLYSDVHVTVHVRGAAIS